MVNGVMSVMVGAATNGGVPKTKKHDSGSSKAESALAPLF